MKKPTITAVLLAKNEENMIANCLKTISWVDKVVVINNGSDDKTAEIAANEGAKVIHFEHSSFARLRNEALKHVETDWVLYLDPDERITPTLAKEILVRMETKAADAMTFNRSNICYGKKFEYGGWQQDQVTRVFKKDVLKEWKGRVHESPVYKGKTITLHTPLIHLTHRNTTDGLTKTVQWTQIEADLLYKAKVKPVSFLTLIRKGVMEFIRRAFIKQGYKDGMPGMVEALVQGINKTLIYIQVWEKQQKPTLPEKYRQQELKITRLWQEEDLSKWKELA